MIEDQENGNVAVPIVLTYRSTTEDYRETGRALLRMSVRQRPLLYLGTILVIALVIVDANPATVLISMGAVLQVLATIGSTRARVREIGRIREKHGEFRTAFDAAGIRTTAAYLHEVMDWSEHPHYTETKNLFLLVRLGAMKTADVLVIPKRGLPDSAAADRLRALLDRHLTRA